MLALTLMGLATARVWADDVFDATGFNRNREYFSQLPYEHIDPMTGNLLLTFTDLVLPGNAGFDLRIQRTYNSKIFPNYPGQTSPSEDTWAGIGWTLHLGRLPDPPFVDVPPPIEMPDGSRHPLYHHVDPALSGRFVTRDFWVYDKNTFLLKLPNGVEYTFGARITLPSGQIYRYATLITDPFGNQMTVTYMTAAGLPTDGIASIVQTVGTNTRTVTFAATNDALKRLSSMTFVAVVGGVSRTRTWTYAANSTVNAGYSLLTGLTPPTGPGWTFGYNTGTQPLYELTSVTSPYGGTITYTYGDQTFHIGSTVPVISRVVKTRVTGGTDIAAGNWTYAYAQGSVENQTVITAPCNKTTHTFSGIGTFTTVGPTWKVGLPTQRKVEEGAATLEIEDLAWRASDPISNDNEIIGNNNSPDINVPLVDTRTITRSPKTYMTVYTYATPALKFNDYGRPQTITETGELSRTTGRTYTYGFSPRYIVDKLGSETVTVGAESFAKSYGYNLANGFMSTQTIYGITKTFAPDAYGNVATVTDANSHARNFQYTWGQVSRIQTPLYNPLLTRAINSDGTTDSQTRRGFTTSFGYDNLSRVTTTTPPAGNVSTTTYDLLDGPSGRRLNRVTRGPSRTDTLLDGFGRPSATNNSVGVNTDLGYDACGRRTYESLPYTSTNTGTTLAYDGLDRLTRRTNADATFATYGYSNGIDVTITNERQKVTVQDWSAFGDPGEARLMGITDADQKLWTYGYNALGSLTAATPPTGSGSGRSWVYYGSEAGGKPGLLKSETHPETGTISYTLYDAAGFLKTRVDPEFGTTTFTYDADDRLSFSDRPGTAYDTTFNWDASNNRTLLQNGYVTSSFGYDGADRLTSRTDTANGRTFVTTFTPDGNDNLQQIDHPAASGLSVRYGYDSENRINDVRKTGAPSAWAQTFSYHPSGAPTSFTAGNGLVHNFTYTNRHWIDSIKSGTNGSVVNLTYGYTNGVGNIDSITDTRPGMSQSFTYDNLDRLWTANGVWGAGSFGYDARGNRNSKTIPGSATSYTYDSTKQQLSSSTGAESDSFSYDANGNLKTATGATFTYTPENMLDTATVGGVATTYRYDGDQTRTLKIQGSRVSYFVHDPKGQILSEFEEPCAGTLVPVRDYVYLAGRLLASAHPVPRLVTVAFVAASSSIVEGSGSVAVGVQVTTSDLGALPCAVSVNYASSNGTAVAPTDYTSTAGTLTFAANSANGTVQNIVVPITPDSLDEDDETFVLTLSGASGAMLGQAVHTVTILDDDPPPALSISDVTVTEGDAGSVNAVFTVSLSAASGKTVSVTYTTADGTATAGSDYLAATGLVTFAPGTTSQTIDVAVLGDLSDEPDETFFVNLSSPTNATMPDSQGVGTILDNDAPPTISIDDAAVIETDSGTTNMTFPVTLSAPSAFTVTASYATSDGTALAGTDYVSASGTVTFAPGSASQNVTIPVIGDLVKEANETFLVTLSGPVQGTIGRGQATGTILDDEPADYFTFTPCRLADTRDPLDPSFGPVLANTTRLFPVTGVPSCAVPTSAKAIQLNVTVVEATGPGNLAFFPARATSPLVSTINFPLSDARANNAVVTLGSGGQVAVQCNMPGGGSAQVIIDVFGYFE